MLPLIFFVLISTTPGPAYTPISDEVCPQGATLTEEHLPTRLYTCKASDGTVLWQKTWCADPSAEALRTALTRCVQDVPLPPLPPPRPRAPRQPGQPPGFVPDNRPPILFPQCEVPALTWTVRCRNVAGETLWEEPLATSP